MSTHRANSEMLPAESLAEKGDGPRPGRAAWRQHRLWVLGSLAVVAAAGLGLLITVLLIPACASTEWWETPGATCSLEPASTIWRLGYRGLFILPVVLGAVLGAITFGPDVENRTHVLALTQSVSRIRWWATKIVMTGLPVFLALVILGFATQWVVDASDSTVISTNRVSSMFDLIGLTPATRFLVAYAAALLVAQLWRTVAGVVAGVVVAGVVIALATVLQPLVVPHVRVVVPAQAWINDRTGALAVGGIDTAYNWSAWADANGNDANFQTDCSGVDYAQCAQDNGIVYRVETWVADSSYPQMMVLISAVNVIVGGAFLLFSARRLRRQDI